MRPESEESSMNSGSTLSAKLSEGVCFLRMILLLRGTRWGLVRTAAADAAAALRFLGSSNLGLGGGMGCLAGRVRPYIMINLRLTHTLGPYLWKEPSGSHSLLLFDTAQPSAVIKVVDLSPIDTELDLDISTHTE